MVGMFKINNKWYQINLPNEDTKIIIKDNNYYFRNNGRNYLIEFDNDGQLHIKTNNATKLIGFI